MLLTNPKLERNLFTLSTFKTQVKQNQQRQGNLAEIKICKTIIKKDRFTETCSE